MKRYIVLLLSALVIVSGGLLVSGCGEEEETPTEPGGGTGGGGGGGTTAEWWESIPVNPGELVIAVDLSGTAYKPSDWGVIPFVVGGFAGASVSNANGDEMYDWDAVTNGGISSNGTGSHILTEQEADSKYYIKVKFPVDDSVCAFGFKFANYSTDAWVDVVTNFWNTIGNQNSGMENNNVWASNGVIIRLSNPISKETNDVTNGGTYVGIKVSDDRQHVLYYLTNVGDWTPCVVGSTTNTVNLTIIWESVPEVRTQSGVGLWYIFDGLWITNDTSLVYTNSNVNARVTGSAGFLSTDGTTPWVPSVGKILTLDASNHTASGDFTVPSGTPRKFEFKMVNELGWTKGEESANQAGILPLAGTYTLTVTFKQ